MRKARRWLRKQGPGVQILFLGLVLALLGFAALASAGMASEPLALDTSILLWLREANNLADPLGPLWVEEAVRDITALGSGMILTLVSLAVVGFVALRRQYHVMGLVLAALLGGSALSWLLKSFFDRPRPEIVPPLSRATNSSFPSGHSLLAAVIFLTLGALLTRLVSERRLKLYIISVASGFTVLVGVSRVYLGVHYPSDVLAGWAVGIVWAILCWLVTRFLQRRGTVESPAHSLDT